MCYRHLLSDDEKRELLRIARATLREYLRTGRIPPGKPHRESLLAAATTFVTIHFGSSDPGCTGARDIPRPLYRAVQEMTVAAAAQREARSLPADAADGAAIEVSVLDELMPVRSPDDIQVGIHGLAVGAGDCQLVLLPRVATDEGWDARTFLEQACARAHLPHAAWRTQGAVVRSFSAQTFSDTTHPARR
jgi:AmmeMemoRadiSam system protein A